MTANLKLTVEIPLFFAFVSFLLTQAITTNLVMYRTCYITLGYSKTECADLGNSKSNRTEYLEKHVQPKADLVLMIKQLTSAIVPIFVCMIAGPWSDRHGRKPVLLMTLMGLTCGSTIMTIMTYFENLSPWYFLISNIPAMFTGSVTTYFTVTLSYLSDISTKETRGIRMALYEAALAGGVLVGSISSSYLFYASDYQTVFQVANGCLIIGTLYAVFFIPESLPKKQINPNEPIQAIEVKNEGSIPTHFKDMIRAVIKDREEYVRAMILLSVASITLFSFVSAGDDAIQFIFLRGKFDWTLTKFTLFSSAVSMLWLVGAMLGTFILHKTLKIQESIITLIGLLAAMSYFMLLLVATNDIFVYCAGIAKCLGGLIAAMLRALISSLVPADEIGKVFSVIVAGGAIIALGASPLYTIVYNATIDINSSLYNLLSVCLVSIVTVLVVFLMVLENKAANHQRKLEKTNIKFT